LRQCTPRDEEGLVKPEPFLGLASGYIQRALAYLPKQGDRAPWKLYQNYALDLATLRYGSLHDGYMQFSNPKMSIRAKIKAAAAAARA
jgi:hypothetical protein